MKQENPGSADKATQGREAAGGKPRGLWWAEASIWTDRMVSALGNGVKGGKWFSLVDKVIRPDDPGNRVAQSRGEQRGGRGGWPERGAVRGAARSFIFRNFMRI